MRALLFFLAIFMICLLSACGSKKARPFTAKQAVEFIQKQSNQVHTSRGRAWVSSKSPEGKWSFLAAIVIDRTNPKKPLLRIEGLDPLGTTHALLVLDANARFTWTDFDQRKTHEMESSWHGLPLTMLPDLMLGVVSLPSEGMVGSIEGQGFDVRMGKAKVHYEMTWQDEQLVVSSVSSKVPGTQDEYLVKYAHFSDEDDFYLPDETELSISKAGQKPHTELKISWRERKWNSEISPQLFQPLKL